MRGAMFGENITNGVEPNQESHTKLYEIKTTVQRLKFQISAYQLDSFSIANRRQKDESA